MEVNENNILSYLRQGEEKAYKYLFDNHYAVLCHFASSIVHDNTMAEDIVCEVFLNIYNRRHSLDIHTSLKNYLLTAVRNRSLNALEVQKKQVHEQLSDSIAGYFSDTDEKVTADELRSILDSSISGLSPECRRVFEKSRVEGKSYQEISEELGISVNTVKYHIKNALSFIRQDIGKYMSSIVLILTTLTQ